MAYNITELCIKCGSCVNVCPLEAISEQDNCFVINRDVCVECGSCAQICPNGALEIE